MIIQMLWGVDAFREAFFEQRLSHKCARGADGCVFCATAQIFESLNAKVQSQLSTPASAEVLQRAVSVLNTNFEFGEKQDATEVHEAILHGAGRARTAHARPARAGERALTRARAAPRPHSARAGLHNALSTGAEDEDDTFVRAIFNNAIEENVTCQACSHVEKPHVYDTWAEYVYSFELMASIDCNGARARGGRRCARPWRQS